MNAPNVETLKVKVLREFLNGSGHVNAGDEIEVERQRGLQLARNGLVELPAGEHVELNHGRALLIGGEGSGIVHASETKPAAPNEDEDVANTEGNGGQKKASEPANKKASEPKNKAG